MKKKAVIGLVALVLLVCGAGAVYAASRCNTCGGKGYRICTPCNGTGQRRTGTTTDRNGTRPTYGACLTCGGSGRLICSSCDGTGYR